MVERFHRKLKSSLKARQTTPNWMDELPLVLLGIRASWKEDVDCSPADLVYGTSLHIPGEFLPPHSSQSTPPNEFLRHLQDTMQSALPMPLKHHGEHPMYKPNNLAVTGFVYVRHDAHRGPLQRPYKGPFKILDTGEKHFTLDINRRPDTVSIDRLKTAYGIDSSLSNSSTPPASTSPSNKAPTPPKNIQVPSAVKPPTTSEDVQVPQYISRYGRKIKTPPRYVQAVSIILLHSTKGGPVAHKTERNGT